MSKGQLIIISGPSGSGKDTLLKEVFAKIPDLKFSISSITRPMRDNEVQGEKYNFISKESFLQMLSENMFLEHNVYCDNYYGTPRKPVETCIENGEDIVVEVDVNGAKNVMKNFDSYLSIFIMPPSFEVLKNRLKGRGTETEEVVNKRLNEAIREIRSADIYDYIVVNDNLEDAVNKMVNIILCDRNKTYRNKEFINEVLSKC